MKKTDYIKYCKAHEIPYKGNTKDQLALKIINYNVENNNISDCFGAYSSQDLTCDKCEVSQKCMILKNYID